MKTLRFIRENNYLTLPRPYKIYIDGVFIDYIEPSEKEKEIRIPDTAKEVKIMVNRFSSNVMRLDTYPFKTIHITSQIQNGLFIFIAMTFLGGNILKLTGLLQNNYLYLALILPLGIIVYWQTFGKDRYLRISKRS